MSITHTFVIAKSDGGEATLVRPSDWNAAHVIELDYAQRTSNLSVTATTEGGADTIVTGNSVSYDGSTVVLIEFFAINVRANQTAAASIDFVLFEDGSSIGIIGRVTETSVQNTGRPIHLSRRMTPASGSHTYSMRAYVSTGTGFVVAGAGGSGQFMPGFIRITKV
jgi:hypothetical protein